MNKAKLFRNFLDSMYRYDPVLIEVIQEGINLLNESESPVDLQYKKERLRSHPFISKLINSRDLYDEYRRISQIFDNATNLTADEFHKLLSFFDGNEEIFSGVDYGIYTERMKLKENVRSIVYEITTKIKQYFDEYHTSKLQNNDTYLYLKRLYDEYKDNPNLDHFLPVKLNRVDQYTLKSIQEFDALGYLDDLGVANDLGANESNAKDKLRFYLDVVANAPHVLSISRDNTRPYKSFKYGGRKWEANYHHDGTLIGVELIHGD